MPAWIRTRTVISPVGTAFVEAVVDDAPRRGIIRRVRATVDPAADAQAVLGAANPLDLAVQVREGPGAAGMGGSTRRSVPLAYPLNPAAPLRTFDSEETTAYFVPGTDRLRLAVAVDLQPVAGPASTVVVTMDIEAMDERDLRDRARV